MGVGSFYYLQGNYLGGIVDHSVGMGTSVPWASAGIASDFMAMMQLAGSATSKSFAAAAGTPIINGGLIALTVASNTLGIGRPEDGERFGTSSSQFDDAHASLGTSKPPADWHGTGSDTYGARNTEQKTRAADMAGYDSRIQAVLADEAKQVENTREFVSKRQTILAWSIPPALAAKLIPVAGPAISAGIEIGAVLATVPFAMDRIENLAHHSSDNAGKISDLAARYESIASEAELPGGGFGA
jgi:hypothetical protein